MTEWLSPFALVASVSIGGVSFFFTLHVLIWCTKAGFNWLRRA